MSENWRTLAACRDVDADLFFPIGTAGRSLEHVAEAKRICRCCQVRPQCLAWALGHGISDGIWGGTTEDERRSADNRPGYMMKAGEKAAERVARKPSREMTPGSGVSDGAVGSRGFVREFATADGERVVVTVSTARQFADLARTTRLGRPLSFLERLMAADFSAGNDLYTHQKSIAAVLTSWFAQRTVEDLTAEFAGTSIEWGPAALADIIP